MEIKIAQESTIEELFTSFLTKDQTTYKFSIPLYQREYSWREKQWEEFLKDLLHSYKNESMNTDYWGNIILYKNHRTEEYEIVDGQQRIITILLLKAAINKIDINSGYLPLKFNDVHNDIWIKIAEEQKLDSKEKMHPLNQAKLFFENYLENNQIDTVTLLEHLNNTILSIVIVDNELESNLLFGRLNTRGVSLSQVDLIKHRLFYKTKRSLPPTGDDVVLKMWKELASELSEMKTSLERFITDWYEIHFDLGQDTMYISFLREYDSTRYLEFLESLLDSAKEINKLKKNDQSDNKIGRNLFWLLRISSSQKLWPILIALQETVFLKKKKILLFEALTVFEFIRSIFPRKDFSEIDKAYFNFAKSLTNKKLPKISDNGIENEINNLKKTMRRLLPEFDEFIETFSNLRCDDVNDWEEAGWEKMLSTYAIYTLNNWLDKTNHGPGIGYRTKDDPQYSIEHIRAKKNATNKEFSPEFLIGNLMVLEEPLNNDIGDKDFDQKIKDYKKSNYPQVSELLIKNKRKYTDEKRKNRGMEWDIKKNKDTNKEEFNDDHIYQRGTYLANCFYDKVEELLN